MLTAPYESPPPYSEFDPAKHDSNPGPARPTSLEIDVETGRDEPEEEAHEEENQEGEEV